MTKENTIIIEDDAPIFKYINPNGNDLLSAMNGLDLQELIVLINDYYIQLREVLGLDQNVTFGLELEYEDADKDYIASQFASVIFFGEKWTRKKDATLTKGEEINSPILRDNKGSWEDLDTVCNIVSSHAKIGNHSGGHIHIGTQVLGSNKYAWLNLIKLWSTYENIIFRFTYGNFLTARYSMKEYAAPMASTFWNDYEYLLAQSASLEAILEKISHHRYQAVNFLNVQSNNCNRVKIDNTIEFRCPNGSLDAVIWQNNVNLFVKLLKYAKSSKFNNILVEERHRINTDIYEKLKWYDEIYLDQALEFCDMIFTNNFDKVYFLKQYLKSLEFYDSTSKYPVAKELTKKGIKRFNNK